MKMNLIAAVGPISGGMMIFRIRDQSLLILLRLVQHGDFANRFEPQQFPLPFGLRDFGRHRPPLITKKGHGRETTDFDSGCLFRKEAFDAFMARNQSLYKFTSLLPLV